MAFLRFRIGIFPDIPGSNLDEEEEIFGFLIKFYPS